ncbi:MAG: hypothetical protein JNM50_03880 [Chromatiales bacterium]|nr:hypothetical protein [Chromatiales bacterium]
MTLPPRTESPQSSSRPGQACRVALLLAAAAMTAACDQALTIPDQFPAPLVETLPLRVGVHYPDAYRDYTYTEAAGGDTEWSIRAGEANVAMFDSVCQRLFRETVRLDAPPAPGTATGYDAYLEPSIEAFEFATPGQSGTNQYSVWIRYRLKVYDRDGTLVTTWPVSAYGQSASSTLQPARSMQEATVLAMRDAAATISTGFPKQKAIRRQLLEPGTAKEADRNGSP